MIQFRINALPLLASAFVAGLHLVDHDIAHKYHLDHLRKEVTEHGFHELHERKRGKRKEARRRLAYA